MSLQQMENQVRNLPYTNHYNHSSIQQQQIHQQLDPRHYNPHIPRQLNPNHSMQRPSMSQPPPMMLSNNNKNPVNIPPFMNAANHMNRHMTPHHAMTPHHTMTPHRSISPNRMNQNHMYANFNIMQMGSTIMRPTNHNIGNHGSVPSISTAQPYSVPQSYGERNMPPLVRSNQVLPTHVSSPISQASTTSTPTSATLPYSINQIKPNQANNIPHSTQTSFNNNVQEQLRRAKDVENQPIISNAPRTKGLPVIESVQSGAITLNKTMKTASDTNNRNRNSIEQQRTPDTVNVNIEQDNNKIDGTQASTSSGNDAFTNFISKRNNNNLTVRSTSSSNTILNEAKAKAKAMNVSKKTPYTTAEQAVQKLQLNHSVSIIPKKKSNTLSAPQLTPRNTPSTTPTPQDDSTIDLSNDETDVIPTIHQTKSNTSTELKCPMKSCKKCFASVELLRRHTKAVHQLKRVYKCASCSIRFATPDSLRLHMRSGHTNQAKSKFDFGIPVVNFNDMNSRQKMLSLGFSNFLPIKGAYEGKDELYGLPIMNIAGSSMDNIKNLFGRETLRVIPIDTIKEIPRTISIPKIIHPTPSSSLTVTPVSSRPSSALSQRLSISRPPSSLSQRVVSRTPSIDKRSE